MCSVGELWPSSACLRLPMFLIARMTYNSHMHVGADLIEEYLMFVEHTVLSILSTNV